jgi:RNA 2',3'-cyclic 3'-phosphodiesterase
VPKERLKSPRFRLFVALDLPADVRGDLEAWQAAEITDPALRPVSPEALHTTLVFLGWTRERDVGAVAEILGELPPEPVRMIFESDPVALPRRGGEKRLFALAAEAPAAVPLQAALERDLKAARLYEPEKRPFWSHVTVARVRKDRARTGRPMRVERPPGPLPADLREPFHAVRITLYRSNLRPMGAEYTPLAQVELPEGESPGRR